MRSLPGQPMNRFLSRLVVDGGLTVALAAALAVVFLLDRQRTPAGTTAARVGLTHEPRPDESTLLTPNRPAPVPANALAAAGPVAKSEKSLPAEAPHAPKVTERVASATRPVGNGLDPGAPQRPGRLRSALRKRPGGWLPRLLPSRRAPTSGVNNGSTRWAAMRVRRPPSPPVWDGWHATRPRTGRGATSM